jgi:hypothetical protein
MIPTTGAPARRAAPSRPDWRGYRYALARTLYAFLLVLVMLLPANFVAYALCTALYHGDALTGALYAFGHHLPGYWVGSDSSVIPVGASVWWMAAVWESLFWASCAAALVVFALWLGCWLAARSRARLFPIARRPSRTVRAA